jgi:hypothetical protein
MMAVTPAVPIPAYQWHTFMGGDTNDGANKPATVVDAYGNLYVTGTTTYPFNTYGSALPGDPTPGYVGYLTKISPTGQLLWSKFYPDYEPQQPWTDVEPKAITLDSAGNIYVAGNGNVNNDGTGGCFVMETDPAGNMIANANMGYSSYWRTCAVYGMAYNPADGYVYITGGASGGWRGGQPIDNGLAPNGSLPANQMGAMFVMQAQAVLGGIAFGWVGFYFTPPGGSFGYTYGQSITFDASSNLIVAGNDNDNVAVWKISNSTGAQQWESVFGIGGGFAVASDGGNVYVAGTVPAGWNGPSGQAPLNAFAYGGTGVAGNVAVVLKLDTNGNYLWHTFYCGNVQNTWGEGIALYGPSTVLVDGPGDLVGYNNAAPLHDTAPTGGGGHYLLALDNNGGYQWHTLYGVLRWDEASSIAVDPQHDVYVSGWSGYNSWDGDNNTLPLLAASGAASEIFVMKFSPATPTTTTASAPAPIVYSPNAQNITLSATVTSTSTVTSGSVAFTLLGTTVSASVIDGSASAAFSVPGGTAAGSYTIQASYIPGTGFAASGDNTQQLFISKATPAIAWSNPADIPYGTALGAAQLDATANVPGSFQYNPPAGTVLAVGNGQTLSAAFTPTDTTDYNSASGTATINVKPTPAQLVVTKTLSRDSVTHEVVVSVTVTNAGGTLAQNVQLTLGKIGTQATTTALPQPLGDLASGAAASTALRFPASTGNSGAAAVLSVGGTYTGGSFTSASRITLP